MVVLTAAVMLHGAPEQWGSDRKASQLSCLLQSQGRAHPLSFGEGMTSQQPCPCTLLRGQGPSVLLSWCPGPCQLPPSTAASPALPQAPGHHPRGLSLVAPAVKARDMPWAREPGQSFAFKAWEGTFPMGTGAPGTCVRLPGQIRAGQGMLCCAARGAVGLRLHWLCLLSASPLGSRSACAGAPKHPWPSGKPLTLDNVPL